MLEKTEGEIKNGQSRETGNIGYGTQDEEKQKHNTTCGLYIYLGIHNIHIQI
jgi:hypothetical protein